MELVIISRRLASVILRTQIPQEYMPDIQGFLRLKMEEYTGHQLKIKLHTLGDHVANVCVGNGSLMVKAEEFNFSIEYD